MIYLHAVVYTALGRAIAIGLATAVAFGLIFLREATSPSGEGYWTAMAAAPNGALYVADELHHELRLVQPDGSHTRVGSVPAGIFRALAADGPNLLLATEGKLWVSNDTGATWRSVLPGRFTAASVEGSHELAGAWGLGLYVSNDAGATWRMADVPTGDTEFESIVPDYAATLLGLLRSPDNGLTWSRLPGLPDRMTTVSLTGSTNDPIRAGDWHGDVWAYQNTTPYNGFSVDLEKLPAAVLSVEKAVVATTNGMYVNGRPVGGPLRGREVTRVVLSGGSYYAAEARGPIYISDDGRSWRLVYQG